ncbi:BBF_HP2_G0004940.mRNA.1.CDS.1 [Saccharomyces cerevisiae]|nr:BBF_HP2_G0004940.mRNA.1.CDS.1 [Saccharomyces cerevisiae]CAI6407328.1 BBF_HP2_G0004940.mRNA.1.CDS.1 [Saccharomyces cerevisiae]
MNVLQFLGFRSDEIKHLFLYGIDVYFCPEGSIHNTDYARAVKRCSSSVSVGAGQRSIVSEDSLGKALAVEECCEMIGIQRILGDIRTISWGPCGIFEIF